MTRWREGGSVEVVLEEDPADDVPPGDTDPDPQRPARGLRRPRGRWAWPAGIATVVVVAALAAVDAAAERRELRDLRRYADVAGVVGSLAEPLGEAWRMPLTESMWPVAGTVIAVDGDAGVLGRDLATGEVRWSVPLPERVEPWAVGCAELDERTTVAVCSFPRWPTEPPPGTDGPADPGDLGIRVIDPVDGTALRELSFSGVILGADVVEGDLVVVEPIDDGVQVTRENLRTGERRWRVDLPGYDPATGVRIHGSADVTVLEGGTTAVLDAADGRELGRWTGATDGREEGLAHVVSRPGVGFGVWESRFAGTWYDTDATAGARLEGEPVEPPVDDGSLPHLVLLESADGDVLRAVDTSTGEAVWQRPAPGRVLVRLGGRLVVTGDGRMQSVDLATGDLVWTVELDESQEPHLGDPYTDGLRLLLRGDVDGELRLTAFDLADGRPLWQSPAPAGSDYVTVVGDRLAAVGRLDDSTGQTLAVLGADR